MLDRRERPIPHEEIGKNAPSKERDIQGPNPQETNRPGGKKRV